MRRTGAVAAWPQEMKRWQSKDCGGRQFRCEIDDGSTMKSTMFSRSFARRSSFLARRHANHAALTPLTFLQRTSDVFPHHTAIVYDDWANLPAGTLPAYSQSWSETAARCSRLASGLRKLGVDDGDTVAILSPNTPAFVEAHHGVNAAGAVLNPLNIRLDAETLAYILEHCEAKVLLADTAFASTTRATIDTMRARGSRTLPTVVDLVDPIDSFAPVRSEDPDWIGEATYEELLSSGDPGFDWRLPRDEVLPFDGTLKSSESPCWCR